MFTVKIIRKGEETLHSAVEVGSGHNGIWFTLPSGKIEHIAGRHQSNSAGSIGDATIYVMNEAGKTVSQYRILPDAQQSGISEAA